MCVPVTSVCVFVCVCVCVCVGMWGCVGTHMCLRLCMRVFVFMCLFLGQLQVETAFCSCNFFFLLLNETGNAKQTATTLLDLQSFENFKVRILNIDFSLEQRS